jgi:hypothetical protein
MGHPQVSWSVQLMTQHGGIPAQLQGDREGQRPATTKSDGMWHFGMKLLAYTLINVRKFCGA